MTVCHRWHDIKEIDDFREYYEFSEYVCLIADDPEDGDGEWTDIAFGIDQIPKLTKRFFCVPFDDKE